MNIRFLPYPLHPCSSLTYGSQFITTTPYDAIQGLQQVAALSRYIFMAFSLAPNLSSSSPLLQQLNNDYHQKNSGRVFYPCQEPLYNRRNVLSLGGVSLVGILAAPSLAWAAAGDEGKDEEGVVGAIKSFLDPDEKTKSGKVLPKAYLKSAREVVKTLRESLKENPKDNAKFRRTADAAKESIRDYLGGWRGNQAVAKEESYVMLEKAIRSLAGFYSKAGPSAALSEEVKSEILEDLNTAEEFL